MRASQKSSCRTPAENNPIKQSRGKDFSDILLNKIMTMRRLDN